MTAEPGGSPTSHDSNGPAIDPLAAIPSDLQKSGVLQLEAPVGAITTILDSVRSVDQLAEKKLAEGRSLRTRAFGLGFRGQEDDRDMAGGIEFFQA